MMLSIALMLVALAPPQIAPETPAPRLRRIEMTSKSWGRSVADWTVDAQGNGRFTVPEPGVHNARRMVTRSFAVGTAGFRRLRTLLGRAEMRGGRELACIQRVSDMVYGEARWVRADGRAASFRFDTGCQDLGARRILSELRQAEDLVAGWAASGPVVETREVP